MPVNLNLSNHVQTPAHTQNKLTTSGKSISFKGTTKVYALSDTHKESRKVREFLSRITDETRNDKNVLFLNNGDIYKGIYPDDIERDSYIKLKEANPDIEMVFTLGNNDFGFDLASLNYLIDTVNKFNAKGIRTVCANIFESSGKRPDWLQPYTIVNRDGDRTFVTGFCIDNINTAKFGITPKKQAEVIDEIAAAIKKEKPDNVVILNHDYMHSSENVVKMLKERGIKTDVVIGGHDHDYVPPDYNLNIFYPQSFSDSMYRMNIENIGSSKKVTGVEAIKSGEYPISQPLRTDLEAYERKSGLLDNIVPYTLHLPKQYSEPCPLGSFLADEMQKTANTDIAFFSTGFLMKPMPYKANTAITNYLFKQTMVAETPIKTVELSASDLKAVFDNALRIHGSCSVNPRFLQCSNNIRIEGSRNTEAGIWEVKQIYVNDEPLLSADGKALDASKKFKCAIDSYIADGGQGNTTIQALPKSDVIIDGQTVKINEVLLEGLKDAHKKYHPGTKYPSFELADI